MANEHCIGQDVIFDVDVDLNRATRKSAVPMVDRLSGTRNDTANSAQLLGPGYSTSVICTLEKQNGTDGLAKEFSSPSSVVDD